MLRVILIIFLSTVCMADYMFCQTKEELENRRKETQRNIENTTRLLQQTSQSRQSSLEQLSIVNRRLQLRQSLISTLESEIDFIEKSVNESQKTVTELEKQLEEAREAYARLIKIAYQHRNSHQRIMYILASENFNQAYRRFKYLQQYNESRRNQIERINELKTEIVERIQNLEKQRDEKVQLLNQQQSETASLNRERLQQSSIVQDLQRRESRLKTELQQQEQTARAIQNAIEELLRAEAKEAAERRIYELTPEEKIISDQFQNNRGGLPWPTERGIVTGFFGEHPHPVLRGIKVQNNGIYISTVGNAEVRALFNGVVRQVIRIPGSNNVILIRHGNYLTVYANLSHVYVRAGDSVTTRQLIGRVFSDNDDSDSSVLELQIWEENRMLDPMLWLSRQ